jgi:hypothetical protein
MSTGRCSCILARGLTLDGAEARVNARPGFDGGVTRACADIGAD